MSDTPAAPERIWATGDGVNGSWTSQEIPPKWGANAAEYVRADAVQAQIDAAVAAERERNAGKVARLEATIRYYERRENWRARETN